MITGKINEILDNHSKWLRVKECGERADLSEANLSGADLSGADLRGADLSEVKNISSFVFEKHLAVCFVWENVKYIKIGCITLKQEKWLERYEKIGKREGYSENQIKAYGMFIKICSELDFN